MLAETSSHLKAKDLRPNGPCLLGEHSFVQRFMQQHVGLGRALRSQALSLAEGNAEQQVPPVKVGVCLFGGKLCGKFP